VWGKLRNQLFEIVLFYILTLILNHFVTADFDFHFKSNFGLFDEFKNCEEKNQVVNVRQTKTYVNSYCFGMFSLEFMNI